MCIDDPLSINDGCFVCGFCMKETEALVKLTGISQCRRGGWNIEVRSFVAGLLAMGFLFLVHISIVPNMYNPFPGKFDAGSRRVINPVHISKSDYKSEGAAAVASQEHTPITSEDCGLVAVNKDAEMTEPGDKELMGELGPKRTFTPYGNAAALFVRVSAYRGGTTSFAVVGLASKPIHVYGNAAFECEWVPGDSTQKRKQQRQDRIGIKGLAEKRLPDWNMGRQYTVVVVNCSFEEGVGVDGQGGELVLYASYGDRPNWGDGPVAKPMERIVALREAPNEYNATIFRSPFRYDFVYCGSPLYGNINAQRVREWVAYHAWLLGPRSHFFLYDAGGINDDVRRVLRPWRRRGYLTVFDVRQQDQFDGYYHNQFLIVNDCFHHSRFLTKRWTFFFDLDEFLSVPPGETLSSVMQEFVNYTQVIFLQKPISSALCISRNSSDDKGETWAMEKLVYRNIQEGVLWDRKYAIQPRNAFATGVHRSDHTGGPSLGYFSDSIAPKIGYYHFHGTLSSNSLPPDGSLCKERPVLANDTMISRLNLSELAGISKIYLDSNYVPFVLDTGLQALAGTVKRFEREEVGSIST